MTPLVPCLIENLRQIRRKSTEGLVIGMEHAAFFAGANYVLDFISGREDIERLWADQRVIQMRMNHIEEVLNSER